MFGLIGQRIVWWFGGYAFRDECQYDEDYEVILPDGTIREGEMDIECSSTNDRLKCRGANPLALRSVTEDDE